MKKIFLFFFFVFILLINKTYADPINSIEVRGDNLKIALEFLEELEENDDVQNVYTNLSAGFN